MAEIFYLGEKKSRPGTYYRVESNDLIGTAGATAGTVAAVFKSNWGSDKVQTVTIDQLFELNTLYGDAADYLQEIFTGGARTIRAIRVGGTNGAKGKVILQSNDATPKDLVEVSARFDGKRDFTVSIRSNLVTGRRQCIFYDGTAVFTQVEFESGGDESQKLVDALSRNKYFFATKKANGKLADVDQKTLSGGKDPTVSVANYTAALSALERYRWNVVVADSDDDTIRHLLYNFVILGYETGHFGLTCIAGKSSETLEDRLKFAASINDWRVVYLLNGWTSNDGKVYEGYLAAARIAGMIGGSETNTSVAHLTVANAYELIENFSNGELRDAVEHGALALSLNDSSQVILDSSITTYITTDSSHDAGWSKIRRARTRFELMERINATCEKIVARVNNDSNGRSTVLALIQKVINEMISEGKLFSGSYAALDDRFPPQADYAYFLLVIGDVDSLEKIYLNYRFSYTFDETE